MSQQQRSEFTHRPMEISTEAKKKLLATGISQDDLPKHLGLLLADLLTTRTQTNRQRLKTEIIDWVKIL